MTDDKKVNPGASPIPPRSLSETISRADRIEKMPEHIRREYDAVTQEYGPEAGVRFLEKWEREIADLNAKQEADRKEKERVQALSDGELAGELKALRLAFNKKVDQLKARGIQVELFLTSGSGSAITDGSNKGQAFGMRIFRNID